MSTLTDQLIDAKAAGRRNLPAPVSAAFAEREAALATFEVPTIPVQTEVPDAQLVTATGEPTTLSALLGGSPAVLVFYRGAWCPYCNVMLRVYQSELLPQLQELGVKLVAVSPQVPDGSLSSREKAELTFDVVSDPANHLAAALGIVDEGTDAVRDAQASIGLDLTKVNAEGDIRLPMPAVVLLDAERRVRWAEVHPDYTSRAEVADIVAAVRASQA